MRKKERKGSGEREKTVFITRNKKEKLKRIK